METVRVSSVPLELQRCEALRERYAERVSRAKRSGSLLQYANTVCRLRRTQCVAFCAKSDARSGNARWPSAAPASSRGEQRPLQNRCRPASAPGGPSAHLLPSGEPSVSNPGSARVVGTRSEPIAMHPSVPPSQVRSDRPVAASAVPPLLRRFVTYNGAKGSGRATASTGEVSLQVECPFVVSKGHVYYPRQCAIAALQESMDRESQVVQDVVDSWTSSVEEEAKSYASNIVWFDMTTEIASKAPSKTTYGKLTRLAAATHVIQKIGSFFDARYARSCEWALEQFRICALSTASDGPERSEVVASLAQGIEDTCRRKHQFAFFQLYDQALLYLAQWRDRCQIFVSSLSAVHRVIDRIVNTFRRRVSGLVFRAWRGYTRACSVRDRQFVKAMCKMNERVKLRRVILVWRSSCVTAKSERLVREAHEYASHLRPRIGRLEAQLESMRLEKIEELADTRAVCNARVCKLEAAFEETCIREHNREEELRKEKVASMGLKNELDAQKRMLEAVSPGSTNRGFPSRPMILAASKLRDAMETTKASKYSHACSCGVEKLLVVWVNEVAGAQISTIGELISAEHQLHNLVHHYCRHLSSGKLSAVEKLRRALIENPAHTSPPLSILCQTVSIFSLITTGFLSKPTGPQKLLKILACFFLLHVCYAHLATTTWVHTSITRAKSQGRLASHPPSPTSVSRGLSTQSEMPLAVSSAASKCYSRAHTVASEDDIAVVATEYSAFAYEGHGETDVIPATNRAWTGIGALFTLWLGRAKQKQVFQSIMARDGFEGDDFDHTSMHSSENNDDLSWSVLERSVRTPLKSLA